MANSPGPNAPCPCGSGKKFKKCCGAHGAVFGFTRSDRESAYRKLDQLADSFGEQDDAAFDECTRGFDDLDNELPHGIAMMSESVANGWFYFDRPLQDGRTLVEVALAQVELRAGELNFLTAAQGTAMHLYEVEATVPGVSITLRDVLEGDVVKVLERAASRSVVRHDWLAARLIPHGPSGEFELEQVLPMSGLLHMQIRDQLRRAREEFLRNNPVSELQRLYKELPPFFHDAWASSIAHPPMPAMANTDGEPMLWTRVTFEVVDQERVVKGMDALEALEGGEDGAWSWSGDNARGQRVSLGRVTLENGRLVLEANSAARAQRGRELIDGALGEAVRHRSTTHEDLTRRVEDSLRNRALGGEETPRDEPEIPPEVGEALVLNHLARHYRGWLDESIPALDGATPREAAKDARLCDRLMDMLRDLEGMYQRSLMLGEPAYDPSWMWAELGLEDDSGPAHPPPLAHERVAAMVPGTAELSRSVAEAARLRPSFSDKTTVLEQGELEAHVSVRRFLRDLEVPANDASRCWTPAQLPAHLQYMINFELHRRKAFWVDEGLTWQLTQTDLDALGAELRVPFPSFALVFTDRRTLSLGERLLAKQQGCPIAGHFLEVAVVYVTERIDGSTRTLSLCFAFDALGADLPQLVTHELVLAEDTDVGRLVAAQGPPPVITDPPVEDASPLRGLLLIVINAILYATSAGVEPVLRVAGTPRSKRTSRRRPEERKSSSEDVYHLPGAIEISQLRRYQSLDRIPDGRQALHRFMVRGHWRRASKNWTDQRMRWIEPYWKGPDVAAVVERTYKLKQ
jgi:hypothetical protein